MKICVVGAGSMGGALVRGWIRSGEIKVEDMTVTASREATLDKYRNEMPGIGASLDNASAVRGADVVVLAVKPWLVETVVDEIKPVVDAGKQIVVSVAAGIGTEKLESMLEYEGKTPAVFYVIPNIAAEFGESMTFAAAGAGASDKSKHDVEWLFGLVGRVSMCPEKNIAPGMMMASCGIAYVMRYIRAQMEGGVEMGFRPAEAQAIAMQTMKGAVALLENTGLHPEAAIDRVTTSGGVTIKGLNELDHSGFNSAVIRSLKAGLK